MKVLLAGMKAPPHFKKDYDVAFDAVYPRLARLYEIPLYPFFLEGVAGKAHLNQKDGIHPTKEGISVIVAGILPSVIALLESVP